MNEFVILNRLIGPVPDSHDGLTVIPGALQAHSAPFPDNLERRAILTSQYS